MAEGETEVEVTALLNDMYRRGLKGKHLRLISSDGSKGIRASIQTVYPYAKWQLCYTHKLRNLASNIRHKIKNRPGMMREASCIYQAETKKQALERFRAFCKKWHKIEPHAVICFIKDFDDTLAYYGYHYDRNFISTTNHIERELEEVRRRIKVQGYFKNEKSLSLWIYGLISLRKEESEEEFDCLGQSEGMPDYTFARIEGPKCESAQLC